MRRYAIFFLLFLIPILSISQPVKKTTPEFVLSGQLKGASNKMVYLREQAFYKNDNRLDSVKADTQGKFTFRRFIAEPIYSMLNTSLNNQVIGFLIENKPMQIKGHADTLYNATITGSPEEAIRQKYDQAYYEFDTNPLYTALEEAEKNNDMTARSKIKQQLKDVLEKQRSAYFKLMRTYPLAYASVNQVANLIAGHQADDLRIADSLLSIYESSSIASSGQVKYFRKDLLAAQKSVIGQEAGNFMQPDTNGNPIELSSFRGHYVLVDFWASWCGPCREENPNLVKAYHEFAQKNFTILSVSLDKSKTQWLKAISKDGLHWTNVGDLKFWQNEAARQFAVTSVPFNMLLDPNGKILALNLRGYDLQDFLRSNLK